MLRLLVFLFLFMPASWSLEWHHATVDRIAVRQLSDRWRPKVFLQTSQGIPTNGNRYVKLRIACERNSTFGIVQHCTTDDDLPVLSLFVLEPVAAGRRHALVASLTSTHDESQFRESVRSLLSYHETTFGHEEPMALLDEASARTIL